MRSFQIRGPRDTNGTICARRDDLAISWHHALVPPGGDGDVRLRRGGTLGPAILLARLQFGTVLAVGLVAAVALGLWAAAPPFLDQVGAAQLKTTVRTADRGGDLSLTSRPVALDPAKIDRLVRYV